MGTLTIYFAGICTHLWQQNPESPDPHRTVLVNARAGYLPREIVPHCPLLRVDPECIVSGAVPQLMGVTITVRDRVATFDYRPSFGTCIPDLERFTVGPVVIDDEVTRGRNPAKTAAYVDVQGGRWEAGVDKGSAEKGGAAVAYVTIETDTPDVALSIETFSGERRPDLVIRHDSTIQVENIGCSPTDNDQDFLLHFFVMGGIPAESGDTTHDEEVQEEVLIVVGRAAADVLDLDRRVVPDHQVGAQLVVERLEAERHVRRVGFEWSRGDGGASFSALPYRRRHPNGRHARGCRRPLGGVAAEGDVGMDLDELRGKAHQVRDARPERRSVVERRPRDRGR